MPDYIKDMIKAIEQARIEAAREREGSHVDLCNVLLKVTKEYKTKGRDYMLLHHWNSNPDREISSWRLEE